MISSSKTSALQSSLYLDGGERFPPHWTILHNFEINRDGGAIPPTGNLVPMGGGGFNGGGGIPPRPEKNRGGGGTLAGLRPISGRDPLRFCRFRFFVFTFGHKLGF